MPFDRLARLVVVAVVGHAVDEEQREHLDAAPAHLQLLFQVLLDGVLDLRPPHVVAHAADFLAQPQRAAIAEAEILVARLGVDLGHLEAVCDSWPARWRGRTGLRPS